MIILSSMLQMYNGRYAGVITNFAVSEDYDPR